MNAPPTPRLPHLDTLPAILRALPAVLWRLAPPRSAKAKPTKLPVQLSGAEASSTDPATWCSFGEAVSAARADRRLAGVGVVLHEGAGVICVDLDKCRDPATGEVAPWALEEVAGLRSFTEVSQSGTGLHVFLRGKLPPEGRKRGDREVYETGRYIAVTGDRFGDHLEVEERQAELDAWHAKHFAPPKPAAPAPAPVGTSSGGISVEERARRYLDRVDAAATKSNGRGTTFVACMHVARGFCIDPEVAVGVMSDWNARCSPPWKPKQLLAKLESARDDGEMEWGLHLKGRDVPRAPPPRAPPKRPPLDEVNELWSSCGYVYDDPDVRAWLEQVRGLSASRITDADLARVLPPDPLPRWARMDLQGPKSWRHTGHRLVVPLYDETATLRSMKARTILADAEERKDVGPLGFDIRGLVMADGTGRAVLRGGFINAAEQTLRQRFTAWITEGVPDFLTAATEFSDADEHAPGVFGVFSGAWTSPFADRIGEGATVCVDVHDDDAGRAYRERIANTFAGRDVRLDFNLLRGGT